MIFNKYCVKLLNEINACTQCAKLGDMLDADLVYYIKNYVTQAIEKNKNTEKAEPIKKIKHHNEMTGSVNMQTLKTEFNSLISDLKEAGLME